MADGMPTLASKSRSEDSLLRTKLFLPHSRTGLVPRPRLAQRLDRMLDYPLTVISAPAGSGKTTLLAEWIALLSLGAENIAEAFTAGPVRLMNTAGENRVCWLSLDEGDNDPVRFLTYLTAVLRTVKPDLGEAALMMLAAPEPPSAEAVLVPLVNELSETHEAALTAHALRRLAKVPGLRIYGSGDPQRVDDRLGVISFDLAGIPHAKVAAILGFEGGIGVRNGCFCAHPYILRLLHVEGAAYERHKQAVLNHDRRDIPGLVRASFGCYNTMEEIDHLVTMLQRISAGEYEGDYVVDRRSGSYFPKGYDPARLDGYFTV